MRAPTMVTNKWRSSIDLVFIISLLHHLPVLDADALVKEGPLWATDNPCSQIRNAQFVCVDCRTTGFCTQVNGGWYTVEFGKCEGLLYCDEASGGCKFDSECRTPLRGPPFECQNPGIYPDPYDCRRYHECDARNELTTHACTHGLGYSLTQRSCSLTERSEECTTRQYDCHKASEVKAWPGESNIYYVCVTQVVKGQVVLYPLLYRCPAGMIFEHTRCLQAEGISTAKPHDTGTKCRLGSLIPVSGDCYAYRKCNDGTLHRCPRGTHFSAESESCVLGYC